VFWVIAVYFNIRNTLPKFGTFLLAHPVYIKIYIQGVLKGTVNISGGSSMDHYE
jgi:hypothetical protein